MTTQITPQEANKIAVELKMSAFVLISSSTFEPFKGVTRTRYTIQKPNGKKFYHLVGYENGTIKVI